MKKYLKPKLNIIEIETLETFAENYNDVFGTGQEVPVSWYTLDGMTSWFF